MTDLKTVLGCMKWGRRNSVCNAGALERIDGIVRIYHDRCAECMRCVTVCPNKALVFLE
ncbi:MAG: 4Fe-4S binding protein [Candidatus Methanoperedens sp.]|nr:4Fe-4S binding protein [Candidatus Methanoperedens sp.]